jgi:hypothetical protein
VFPARYELNSYIVFRKRLVSKRLICIGIASRHDFANKASYYGKSEKLLTS